MRTLGLGFIGIVDLIANLIVKGWLDYQLQAKSTSSYDGKQVGLRTLKYSDETPDLNWGRFGFVGVWRYILGFLWTLLLPL